MFHLISVCIGVIQVRILKPPASMKRSMREFVLLNGGGTCWFSVRDFIHLGTVYRLFPLEVEDFAALASPALWPHTHKPAAA